MNSPAMIMVAPTGSKLTKKEHPRAPLTPKEIADDVVRCAQAGASIAHVHARDAQGKPSQSADVYREIIDRIRERCDVVIQISLGMATPGFSFEDALLPIALPAEMASLPLVPFLTDDKSKQAQVREMAVCIQDSGKCPELSVYDERMLAGALSLIDCGAVKSPACFGLIVRDPASLKDGQAHVDNLVLQLPVGSQWWLAKGGDFAFELRSHALETGGHVRVGFEDSVNDFGGHQIAPTNAHFVDRMVELCAKLGRPVATAAQARHVLSTSAVDV